jgi:hypothetical protein
VAGGPALATTRVLLGIDRVLADNFSAGARLGYAFGGAPARLDGPRFFAFHFEVRASYWIGSRPFETSVVRPYVTLGGGKTQVDAEKTVTLHNLDPQPNGRALPSDARDQSLSAWRKTGTTFVAAGGGALVSLSRRTALSAELRAAQLFGTPGTALGVQIGIALGL